MTGSGRATAWINALVHAPSAMAAALRAWRTLEPADWSALADKIAALFGAILDAPRLTRLYGRILRSGRRFDEAVAANESLLRHDADDENALLELGRAHRSAGRRQLAIDAFASATAKGSSKAIRELRRYGASERLPVGLTGLYARQNYSAFVEAHPVPEPPEAAAGLLFRIIPAAGCALATETLASLQAQSHRGWFVNGGDGVPELGSGRVFDLPVPPGAVLDPHCLAWLNWTIAETGCDRVRADHDHRGAAGRCNPIFLPYPDALWTDGIAQVVARAGDTDGGSTAHVPLVLMTLPEESDALPGRSPVNADPQPISVIIPSCDNPGLLATAVESLLTQATCPDQIEIILVDNESRTPAARQMFAQLAERDGTRTVQFPEPFNWSRINNAAALAARHERLLLLNDDTKMLTVGWDGILSALLDDPRIGAVGARMTYPDGSIQHGGFVFGMDDGPQHEGRWAAGDDAGPAGRWTAVRQAAAVTGAFLGTRRAVFDRLSGFDEIKFAVDFADVDFCMRVRAAGLAVAYCGAISLTHHESVSRGLNLSRRKRARMRREAANMRARWGDAVDADPGYHPVWSRAGCSYDALREVSREDALRHVRASSRPSPWSL